MTWLAWIAAKGALGWAFGRQTVTAARGGSATAAIAITAAMLAAVCVAGWAWLTVHDAAIEHAATTACVEKSIAEAKDAENRALRAAIYERSTQVERATEQAQTAEAKITLLEREKKELRDALAATADDSADVFGTDDRWLRGRAAASPNQARRGRSGARQVP